MIANAQDQRHCAGHAGTNGNCIFHAGRLNKETPVKAPTGAIVKTWPAIVPRVGLSGWLHQLPIVSTLGKAYAARAMRRAAGGNPAACVFSFSNTCRGSESKERLRSKERRTDAHDAASRSAI